MYEILTNPWITLPLLVGVFVLLFTLGFRQAVQSTPSPVSPSPEEIVEKLQSDPNFTQWDWLKTAQDRHSPKIVLGWMVDELLSRQAQMLRHRQFTTISSQWAGVLNALASNPNTPAHSLHRIACESQSRYPQLGVCFNPSTAPASLLHLTGSEWEDVRTSAYSRLQDRHGVFAHQHGEEVARRMVEGERTAARRRDYQKTAPVWQPPLYSQMHSESSHYPKESNAAPSSS